MVYDTCTYVVQGDFLTGSLPLFGDKMKKGPRIQPEAFLYEGFHGRGALVGFVAFFNFGTEQGVGQLKITLYVC